MNIYSRFFTRQIPFISDPKNIVSNTMASEITQEEDEDDCFIIKTEAHRNRIRQIIEHQKSLYFSSSASVSYSSTASSSVSSRTSHSLLGLMKGGNTSLRRLFEMEHTSLATHMKEYSGSPIIKPLLLWGSDTDDGICDDPWRTFKKAETVNAFDSPYGSASEGSFIDKDFAYQKSRSKWRRRKLNRTKSFRRLPRFIKWTCRGFRFRFRLRRIRIMICGRIY
uniref:Uncharacterized protein n=2 Tax=Daucus carota subsp. sativus TaxID=79200 RepID=A0A162A518_DAUCS